MSNQDNTNDHHNAISSSSAPTSGHSSTGSDATNLAPEPGPEAANTDSGSGKDIRNSGTGRSKRTGRKKGSKNLSAVSPERREQLQEAGKAGHAKAIAAHPDLQVIAGKALAAQRSPAYMQKIGAAGHAKAIEATPDLQTKAARTGRGHRRIKHKCNRRKRK